MGLECSDTPFWRILFEFGIALPVEKLLSGPDSLLNGARFREMGIKIEQGGRDVRL